MILVRVFGPSYGRTRQSWCLPHLCTGGRAAMSEQRDDHSVGFLAGAALSAMGVIALVLSFMLPAAHAAPNPQFQGACTGTVQSGTCILDEPEGNDPSTQGTVDYVLTGKVLAFTIDADDPITEVQICMQTSGPFD